MQNGTCTYTPNGCPGLGCMPGRSTGASLRAMPNHRTAKRMGFSADSRFCLPVHPGLPRSFTHRETNFALLAPPFPIHGTMAPCPRPAAARVLRWWRGVISISSVSAAAAVCLDVVDPAHLYVQLAAGSAPPE